MFTVKKLSTLAGVTPRTLHHYDRIGLLKPSRVGENGYRYYGEESVLRLQQILFYRELDLPLEEVKRIMGRRDFDLISTLESHRVQLGMRIVRLERLIQTVDNTIDHLKGITTMSSRQIFAGFSEEEERKFAEEAERLYDPTTVRKSNLRWKGYTAEQKHRILDEGNKVYVDMIAAISKGAESREAQAIVERWRKHMDYFWTPTLDQLLGLAEMYVADKRFTANFNRINPKLAEFMLEAVKVYAAGGKK
jgi:DNA-binding transcriptional MerR regulator